jgi:uncharacterized protein (UPF0264 family)
LSIALGDFADPDDILATFASLALRWPPRPAPLYLKLGFAGVNAPGRLESMITTAVEAAQWHQASPRIVAVAYADSVRAGTASPDTISRVAAECGAAGVLVDTHTKDGKGLLSWIDPPALELWVERGRGSGLLTAVAGGLRLDDIGPVSAATPDVVGVRGAACDGGREGWVNAARVRGLRVRLRPISGSVQGTKLPACGEWVAKRVIPARIQTVGRHSNSLKLNA